MRFQESQILLAFFFHCAYEVYDRHSNISLICCSYLLRLDPSLFQRCVCVLEVRREHGLRFQGGVPKQGVCVCFVRSRDSNRQATGNSSSNMSSYHAGGPRGQSVCPRSQVLLCLSMDSLSISPTSIKLLNYSSITGLLRFLIFHVLASLQTLGSKASCICHCGSVNPQGC